MGRPPGRSRETADAMNGFSEKQDKKDGRNREQATRLESQQ